MVYVAMYEPVYCFTFIISVVWPSIDPLTNPGGFFVGITVGDMYVCKYLAFMNHPKVPFDYLILDRSNILICLFSDTYLWVDIFVYLIILTRYLFTKCGNIVSGVVGNHKVIDGSLFFNLGGTPWFKAPHSFMISLHFYYTWRYLFELSTFNISGCEIRLR